MLEFWNAPWGWSGLRCCGSAYLTEAGGVASTRKRVYFRAEIYLSGPFGVDAEKPSRKTRRIVQGNKKTVMTSRDEKGRG